MSSFYFMELKPPYFGYFWVQKHLKLMHGNRNTYLKNYMEFWQTVKTGEFV